MKKLMLVILDGWGITNSKYYFRSAIRKEYTPFFNYCLKNYPSSKLQASGSYVGLPDNQMGNSEVGHINLGSGRKITQNLKIINNSIKNESFFRKLEEVFSSIKYNKNIRIHCIGLLSDGGIHSHIGHLFYLLKFFHKKNIKNIFIHAFTDGRDSYQKNGIKYIKKLLEKTKKYGGILSTVIGRFYSMDRDLKWNRTKIAYDAMVNLKGVYTDNIIKSIENSYNNNITDEFLFPFILRNDKKHSNIRNGDIVFCFNFRGDRSRQIIECLINYKIFSLKNKINLFNCLTMTCFNEKYKNVTPIFKQKKLLNTLGEILEKEGKKQIRIAETEKYPHVTFFFSGGRETPFYNEYRILCPSPKVSTYDLVPEMSAMKIANNVISILNKKEFDFICVNFANPDMVGHTGNMKKTIIACNFVDKCLNLCCKKAIENSYIVFIVGDHGNADYMINEDGTPNTTHSNSLVPFIILDQENRKNNIILKEEGALLNVSPTILNYMKLPIPSEMTGNSMITYK